METNNLYFKKFSLVKTMFINTADDNYLLARYCFYNFYPFDFFWLSMQSLEKYMKASLLLNGKNSKKFGHDLEKLNTEVRSYARELLDFEFEKPINLDCSKQYNWTDETPIEFIKRLSELGNPDSRYCMHGVKKTPDLISKLDKTVYQYRRICRNLEKKHYFEGVENTAFKALQENTQIWRLETCLLEKILSEEMFQNKKHTFLKNNASFPSEETIFEDDTGGHQLHISAENIINLFNDSIETDNNNDDFNHFRDWVFENVVLPKRIKDKIPKQ